MSILKKFNEQLSDKVVNNLKQIINSTFLGIHTTSVDINPITNQYILSIGSLFYEIDNERYFINISNEWLETDLYSDYYRLKVFFDRKPIGIEYKNNAVYNAPVSIWYEGIQEIKKIEIYNFMDSEENEEVNYDSSLVFYFNDEKALLISALNDITDRLVLKLSDVNHILRDVEGLNLRVEIS